MIIPIRMEEESGAGGASNTSKCSVIPVVTFPNETTTEIQDSTIRRREKGFGDILIPALSKYLQLRDSKRRDLSSLLVKEHPIQFENFKNTGDKYELQLNVQKFKPEELHVKITNDFISILGEHEEKKDRNNFMKQEFMRRYSLPAKVNADDIKCELSSDGYLLISAPKINQKLKITEIPSVPIDRHNTGKEYIKSI